MSVIYGKKIRLRAVEREDIKKFHEWVNDPQVTINISMYLPMSLEDETAWFEGFSKMDRHERPLAIEIRKNKTWKIIGNCGVFNLDFRNGNAELGIMIGDKTEWNKGYGTDAMTALSRHCFETLDLHRVYLRVYESHVRAARAYEKVGFVLEGKQRDAVYKNGKHENVLMMSLLRSEWDARTKEK
ncbi:MAG: GNAT family N-acetyltransferase [Anaerolineales bacterium]|nr:GNAT family N-acetyltransferase [Anaerolineales bacterium]